MVYLNGQVPYSVVSVVLDSGTDENGPWEFRCTPAFAVRWAFAKREAERRFGRTIYIRTGWNVYRPLFSQQIARTNACNSGNCMGAAYPGSSSHGGEWQGRPCLAVDVDPNGLTWDQVDEVMEAAGFSARLITEAMSGIPGGERWHYIDFNAFGAVPAFAGFTPFDPNTLEDLMNGPIVDVDTTLWIARADGEFERYLTPKAPNSRGIISLVFCGGPGGETDTIPKLSANDFEVIKTVWRQKCRGLGSAVWGHPITAQTPEGVPVDPPRAYSAAGYIASTNARVGGAVDEVDEEALAAALAPLITSQVGSLSDEDVARIASAANDEQDRRERARLEK